MKFITQIALLLTTVFFYNSAPEKERTLQIIGKTVGTDTKSIILLKPNQSLRFDSLIEIPVIDGKFNYESKLEHPEAVTLFLGEVKENGRGHSMPLFLENEKIDLTIYPEDKFNKNIVNGGKLNSEYKKYKESLDLKFSERHQAVEDSLDILVEKYRNIINELDTLNTKLEKVKNQDDKSSIQIKIKNLKQNTEDIRTKVEQYEKKSSAIYFEQNIVKHEYMKDNQTLVSYFFLLSDLESYIFQRDHFNRETIDMNLAKNTFDILKKTFPDHPYNNLASNLIEAIENIKVGNKYVDFSAPDLNGNKTKLSSIINGKVALLDLWATWCGPCIRKSRTMVPLYDEYKDKGFTIVGVAGEFKNTDRLVKFIEKENWEWLNLVELDRQNNIWQKYGVRGGGGIFLIDEKGIIIAKNPTAAEVRKELESRLN